MLQLAGDIVLFDKIKHQRDDFDCGNETLNIYLKQVMKATETIGVMCAVVEAKPDAVDFYQKFGFQLLAQSETKLYLPVSTLNKLFVNN